MFVMFVEWLLFEDNNGTKGEKEKMKNDLPTTCKVIRDFINSGSCEVELSDEVELHLENCPLCKSDYEENLQVKKVLKRAVEKTPVPENLKDQIWEKIRKS